MSGWIQAAMQQNTIGEHLFSNVYSTYNFGFVQFHHLRIEDLQNFSAFLGSVSILSENLRELIENKKHIIRTYGNMGK